MIFVDQSKNLPRLKEQITSSTVAHKSFNGNIARLNEVQAQSEADEGYDEIKPLRINMVCFHHYKL
jgi:hypothetical protein